MASIKVLVTPYKVGTIWFFPCAEVITSDGVVHYVPPFQFRTVGDNKDENHFYGLDEVLTEEQKIEQCLRELAQKYEDKKVVGINYGYGKIDEENSNLLNKVIE